MCPNSQKRIFHSTKKATTHSSILYLLFKTKREQDKDINNSTNFDKIIHQLHFKVYPKI